MAQRSAIVVGGGIGGLATAAALVHRGWAVRVFERAAGFAEVGAGISVWSNALRALDAIRPGLADAVRERGTVEVNGGVQDRTGRWLSTVDAAEVVRRYGPVILLHRGDLLGVLLDAVPTDALVPGVEVTGVEGGTVTYPGGEARADLVVGADGLRSAVRRSAWPDAPAPRYAGYTAWRWIAPAPDGHGQGGESWGRGTRLGHAPLPDGRVYCYATDNTPEGATAPDEAAELAARFGDWHDPIPALVRAARDTTVLRHDIYELPNLPSFAAGRVALLGDAAHAMTPNLGQGACQALEDAATLAAVLDGGDDVATALNRYDRLRRRRTQTIVKRSRQMGALGQWSWPPAVLLRDRLLPLIPAKAALRSLDPVLAWSPPSATNSSAG